MYSMFILTGSLSTPGTICRQYMIILSRALIKQTGDIIRRGMLLTGGAYFSALISSDTMADSYSPVSCSTLASLKGGQLFADRESIGFCWSGPGVMAGGCMSIGFPVFMKYWY